MGFLRKLFGGGSGQGADKDGIYCYIRANTTGEVIQVRLHRYNDLSQTEDETGYYTRKVIVGQRSFDRIEAEFYFDKNRKLTSGDVIGGTLVDADDYYAYLDQQAHESET